MTDNLQPSVDRTCRKCGAVKPLEDFAIVYVKNSKGVNYRQHYCKKCARRNHAERMRRARKNNPEKYKRIMQEHRARNRDRVLEQVRQSGICQKIRIMNAYGGQRCVCCGETCLTMLTIDHVNNDGAKHRRSLVKEGRKTKSVDLYVWLEINKYPSGFQVLCYNCNLSKHRNGGVCEHVNEGSTTIPKGSSSQAIGGRSAGRPRIEAEDIVCSAG